MNSTRRLIVLEHFACSGGTIFSKAVAAMNGVIVLSEIHPDRHLGGRYHPLVQLETGYGDLLSDSHRHNFDTHFVREIEVAYETAQELGRELVVRDHAYRDFVQTDRFRSRLIDVLDSSFKVDPLVLVRDPIDSYLSHRTNSFGSGNRTWFDGSPDEFCERFLHFIDAISVAFVVRYEDFVTTPSAILKDVCANFCIGYNDDFCDLLGFFLHFTGDSGRRGSIISPRPRRPIDESVRNGFLTSNAYAEVCARLRYTSILEQ